MTNMKAMGRTIWLLLVVASAISLSACNTVQGMGKDIKKAGEKIEETAD